MEEDASATGRRVARKEISEGTQDREQDDDARVESSSVSATSHE